MEKRKKQRIISFFLTICMMLAMTNGFSVVTFAATDLDVSTGNVDITESGDYIITGSTNTNTIKVEPNITGVNITLNNVNIDVSSTDGACAFDIGDGASVNVTLADGTTNTFKSGASKAGLKVEAPVGQTAGSINIDGTGTLIAVGGKGDLYKGSGAGIGSNGIIVDSTGANTIPASGNITIKNGTIQATGGLGAWYAGSGIGGGGGYDSGITYASNGGNTTIHGGNVTAIGGSATNKYSGAGIGGGSGYNSGNGGTVFIDGGNVTAKSGDGWSVSSAIGNGIDNNSVRTGTTSITIKGSAVVNASIPNANRKYPTLYSTNLTIGGNAVLKASNDTGNASLNYGGVIFCNSLTITDRPEITALASTKTYAPASISTIYAGNTSSTMPIISGIFASPLSTTTDTDVVISGGSSTNTKTITMPANYTSFATTVDSIGRYTGSAGTNVLQDTGASANIFNLTKKINQYNLALVAQPVDQEAPTGLAGTAPTTAANNDGKITGTTASMEYKLASAEDNTYKACTDTETTGLAAGDYIVRYAAKTGFNAGTTAAVTISQFVDNIPPVINSVTGNPSDWTSDSVTLTVNATDAESGLAAQAYSFDGGTNWQEGNTKAYDTNTNGIVIKVKDNAGNVAAYDPIDITKIDKTAPTNAKITVEDKEFTSFLNTITFGLFFNNTVGVTITPGSDISGINKVEYQKVSDASDYKPGGTWTEGSSLSVNPDEKFIIYAKITDNAGNYVIINSDGVVVDATQPALEVTPDTDDWTKDNVNVNVKVSDNLSGVKEATYTTDETAPQSGTVAITNGEGNITLSNEGQYKLTVTAKDNSLNEITKTVDIKLDKSMPVINSVTGNPSDWTSASVTLTVDANDAGSGLAAQAYSFDGGTTWQEGNTKTYDTNTNGIVINVKDNAGNIATYDSIDITKINKTAPSTAVIKDAANYTDSKWFNETQTITASFTKTNGCGEKLQYKVDNSAWTDGGLVDVSTEGKHVVNFRVIDTLGRTSEVQTVSVNIDATQPALEVTPDTDDWTKDNVNVKVKVSDNLSGVNEVSYTTDETVPQSGTVAITNGEGTITLTNGGQYKLTVSAKDDSLNEINKTVDIKLDKSMPVINSVTGNPSDWTSNSVILTVNATDAGSGLALQAYSFDGGTNWQSGNTKTYDTTTNGIVIKVKDNVGNIAAYDPIDITKIDKTAPTNAKITVEDKEFTSFLNTITFGLFFNNTVGVTITPGSDISGINKVEYQKVSDASDYKPGGTWTEGSSLSVNPDEKFIIYAKITDNAGNYVIINSDGVVVDATQPALEVTPDISDWTKDNVNVNVKVSDNLSGVKEATYTTDETAPQSGTVAIINGEGTITLTNEGQYKLTVTAKDNSLNEINESTDIKIDRTIPAITGASNSSSYFIGRVIKLTDNLSGIAGATYKNGTDTEASFKDGDLFEKAGKYTLTLKDKAGNSDALSFEIKALPSLTDVVYTTDCKELIDNIRFEFNSHNDLPEPYNTNINNEIKALEDRYAQLDNEVIKIKAETSAIKAKVDKLPNGVDGLLNLQKEIQEEYNIIAGNASTLTEEQKKALAWEAEYLEQQLKMIATLQNQINSIKTQVSNIDTKDDGLISQEGKIDGILSDIDELNNEQQIILKPQSDLLNSLLSKINMLKEQVNTVKGMINSLPSPDKVTKQDADNINNIYKLYNAFTNEQKELLGEDLSIKLYNIVDVLKKLMLYDANTDTTVIGVDGTSFNSDVYIVVMPIKQDDLASKGAENASKNISIVEGKELVALYDISLLKDGIKIQPDGKVKVKIRIPEELRGRIGLDIAHIADDGTVTPMNATVEGDYLVFTTTHFSEYAIVAKPIAKELPKTGSIFDFDSLIFVGLLLSFIGIFLIRKKEERVDRT